MPIVSENRYRVSGTITTGVILSIANSESGIVPSDLTWTMYGDGTYSDGAYAPTAIWELKYRTAGDVTFEITGAGDANDIKWRYATSDTDDTYTAWSAEADAIGSTTLRTTKIYTKMRFIYYSTLWTDTDNVAISATENYSIISAIKGTNHKVFRRLSMKRRLSGGDYDTTWQVIPNKYIIKFGSLSYQIDDVKVNFYKLSGMTVDVSNDDGYFSDTTESKSFFYNSLSRYNTLVKIEAGYYGRDGATELPTSPTLFIGLIGPDMPYNENNVTKFTLRHLSSIFEDFPADKIAGLGATQTASDMIAKIRDHQDSTGTYIFRKYITTTSWSITSTTINYNFATSTAIQGKSCWDLMKTLAEAEDFVVYVSRDGKFLFNPKTAAASVTFHFSGLRDADKSWGHTISKQITVDQNIEKVYNRIRIKFGEGDTTSSYYIKSEPYIWGDTTSSFLYGIRTYEIQNDIMTQTIAATIADQIYTEYRWPKQEVRLIAKFVPQMELNDRVSVTYKTVIYKGEALYGYAVYDTDVWGERSGLNINIDNGEYRLTQIKHNLDAFTTEVTMREI